MELGCGIGQNILPGFGILPTTFIGMPQFLKMIVFLEKTCLFLVTVEAAEFHEW